MKINLPKLEITHKQTIGELQHVFFDSHNIKVKQEKNIQISPRKIETVIELVSGQKIIVTKNKTIKRPNKVDGVIYDDNQGTRKWLSHRLLDEFEKKVDSGNWNLLCNKISNAWLDTFVYKVEEKDESGNIIEPGLRPPQIGALHSIGAHWSLSDRLATIAMPTGTGKTEVMLSVLFSLIGSKKKLLVVVPNKALLKQTAEKFLSLGLLRELGAIPLEAQNPIVGIIKHRSKSATDLDIFDKCHIAITTPNAISNGTAINQLNTLATKCTHLIFDEAHHVPSRTWSNLREAFKNNTILQFTATPWRSDGKPVDGKTIFHYPLSRAQEDGYFKEIIYTPLLCIDENQADLRIAEAAIKQLNKDISENKNHVLMARCNNIKRAMAVFDIYHNLGSKYKPVLVHNKSKDYADSLNKLHSGESKILVCVNMFGEGFDLPELKIAAIHDAQKSIATLLQFIGRFTRTSTSNIGNATVIANIANDNFSDAFQNLFSEDADWNKLLSKFSSDAMRSHIELTEFLSNCKRLDDESEDSETAAISPAAIFPKFSTLAFKCTNFIPTNFINAFEGSQFIVRAAWLNEDEKVLFFITKNDSRVSWGKSKSLNNRSWDLFVTYFNPEQQILYIHTSDNDLKIDTLVDALSGNTSAKINGNSIFRCLGNIKRLMFQQVGLKKHGGRRNLRYSMYSGTDVRMALSPAQTANSTKSNVSGGGYEGGRAISIGCSYKGRIWSREKGTIQKFTSWCNKVGDKLNNTSIDTEKIIDNVLIPRPVGGLPEKQILCMDWPVELIQKQADRILLISEAGEFPFSQYDIELKKYDRNSNEIYFEISHDTHNGLYKMKLTGETNSESNPPNFHIAHISGKLFEIKFSNNSMQLNDWFNDYPPEILFLDGDELMGCDLIELKEKESNPMPSKNISHWDWSGVDIKKESMWKNGELRENSIQNKVYKTILSSNFDVIYNDDSKGEAADLVCIKEHENFIQLKLIHCKFSGGVSPGQRVKDAVEVCSQAIRSSRWIWRFKALCSHLVTRENNLKISGVSTRFLFGDISKIKHLLKASRFKEIKTEIVIVQPGISKNSLTDSQSLILSSTYSYLIDTVNTGLSVICSQ